MEHTKVTEEEIMCDCGCVCEDEDIVTGYKIEIVDGDRILFLYRSISDPVEINLSRLV